MGILAPRSQTFGYTFGANKDRIIKAIENDVEIRDLLR